MLCFLLMSMLAAGQLGPVDPTAPQKVTKLPFVFYDECDNERLVPYAASGWMGAAHAVERKECSTDDPHSGKHCIKIKCGHSRKWYGIVWQDPPGDWGQQAGGWDLRKARKLTFWARGAKGGERIEAGFGVIEDDAPFPDSVGRTKEFELTPEWKKYTVHAGGDRSRIKTGFMWSARGAERPFTFYLDDIQYEE
jgi:hypothetical protein